MHIKYKITDKWKAKVLANTGQKAGLILTSNKADLKTRSPTCGTSHRD